MLSILIPTYHYNAFRLAEELEKQALVAGIIFEIICIDDGSFAEINIENQKINNLTNSKFIEGRKNLGRSGNRSLLAEHAQYDWLLFIDSDMFPVSKDFVIQFLHAINPTTDLIFGGISYEPEPPSSSNMLRWLYGHEREAKSVELRNRHPYISIIMGCIVIKKKLFKEVNRYMDRQIYGLDILFTAQLKKLKAIVVHIDNPAHHLGLDHNEAYLRKSRLAVETLFDLYHQKKIPAGFSKLSRTYRILRTLMLSRLCGMLLKPFHQKFEHNLMGTSPNLMLFDLYRLGYLCRLKNSNLSS